MKKLEVGLDALERVIQKSRNRKKRLARRSNSVYQYEK